MTDGNLLIRMNIESWCQVEGNSNQKWMRSTRRHYDQALRSTVFQDGVAKEGGRVDWSMAEKPDQEKLAKKKHFQQKCESITVHVAVIIIHDIYTTTEQCFYTDETTLR